MMSETETQFTPVVLEAVRGWALISPYDNIPTYVRMTEEGAWQAVLGPTRYLSIDDPKFLKAKAILMEDGYVVVEVIITPLHPILNRKKT